MKPTVDEFYPDTGLAFLGLLACTCGVSTGLLLLVVGSGAVGWGVLVLVMSAMGLDCFLSLHRLRVVVGPDGIAKHARSWLGGFEAQWAEVVSWTIELSYNEETPGMRIVRLRTARRVFEVSEANVSATGFEPFLVAVRRSIGGREKPG